MFEAGLARGRSTFRRLRLVRTGLLIEVEDWFNRIAPFGPSGIMCSRRQARKNLQTPMPIAYGSSKTDTVSRAELVSGSLDRRFGSW